VAVVALALVGGGLAFVALGDDEEAATTTPTAIVRPGDPTSGRAVFASTGCGACHTFVPAGSAGEVGPALDGTQLTVPELREVIAYGNGAMPGYDGDLTPQEIADVAAFVHSG
jgi:mono/diheme cytochrome c family protein